MTFLGKHKKYSVEDLKSAVEAVKTKKLSIGKASQQFGVPKSTISYHTRGKVEEFPNPGGDKMLSEVEEIAVVEYMLYMSRRHLPVRRKDIRLGIVVGIKPKL